MTRTRAEGGCEQDATNFRPSFAFFCFLFCLAFSKSTTWLLHPFGTKQQEGAAWPRQTNSFGYRPVLSNPSLTCFYFSLLYIYIYIYTSPSKRSQALGVGISCQEGQSEKSPVATASAVPCHALPPPPAPIFFPFFLFLFFFFFSDHFSLVNYPLAWPASYKTLL